MTPIFLLLKELNICLRKNKLEASFQEIKNTSHVADKVGLQMYPANCQN